jgi:hypothetical protein
LKLVSSVSGIIDMIDETYFNGERAKLFATILEKTKNILAKGLQSTCKVDPDKVMLDNESLVKVERQFGTDYLLPFCVAAKKIRETPVTVTYELPGNYDNDPDKLEIKREYIQLDSDLVRQSVDNLISGGVNSFVIGKVPSKGFMPPPFYSSREGQMKIAVDAVLAVDAMLWSSVKGEYNILIIGSGSPGGVRCGVGYTLIPNMCNATVTMYDPWEVSRNYELSSAKYKVRYRVIGQRFDYNWLLEHPKFKDKFDLVLDDSWVKGMPRNSRDENDAVLSVPHFSIKQFPWERGRPGNVYFQKFYSEGLEERRVSRNVREVTRVYHPLGTCVACLELRLRLLLSYEKDFYLAFMAIHAVNCQTGAKVALDVITQFDGWIRVEPFLVDFDNYCSMNFDFFFGSKMISATCPGISDIRVVFSSRRNVPDRILSDGLQVLVIESSGEFYVNKLLSETPYNQVRIEELGGTINLSHSQGVNERISDVKDQGGSVAVQAKKIREVELTARVKVVNENLAYKKKKKRNKGKEFRKNNNRS